MKSIVVKAPGDIRYVEVDKPKPGPREVLTRVRYCGICGTDLEIFTGDSNLVRNGFINYPVRIGHEWSGVIEEVGSEVKNFKPGDRVAGGNSVTCGECKNCKDGNYGLCKNGLAVGTVGNCWNGAFAEYMIMPYWHMYKINDNVSLDEAALFEPASIALSGVRQSDITPESTVLITGTGAIGLSAVGLVKSMGAKKILLAGRKDFKLEIGKKMGADAVVNVTKENLKEFVMKETNNEGVNSLVETSGSVTFINESFDFLARRAVIALIGFYDINLTDCNINKLVLRLYQIRGIDGTGGSIMEIAEMVSKGKLSLKPLITHRFNFDETIDTFKSAHKMNDQKIKMLVEVTK